MTVWKRANLFLIRNKNKTLILLLMITVMASSVLAGLSVGNAINHAKKKLRETMVGYFSIETNVEQGYTRQVDDTLVKTVEKLEGVMTYNGLDTAYMYVKDISLMPGRFAAEGDEKANMTLALGNTDSEMNEYFVLQMFRLLEGRHIELEDIDKAVISEDLAKRNNLKIGDSFVMLPDAESLLQTQKAVVGNLEIIGIYRVEELSKTDGMDTAECDMDENFIFTDTSFIRSMQEQILNREIHEYSKGAVFFVEDVGELESVVNQVLKISGYDWNEYLITKNNKGYEDVAEPLNRMSGLLTVFVAGIVVVSMAVLTLILFMWMKDRMYEIGIFLSIGISKKEVLEQHILENSIVALASFLAAGGFIMLVADPLSSLVIGMDVQVRGAEFFGMVGIGYSIVVLSTVLASVKVFRIPPKEILSMSQ